MQAFRRLIPIWLPVLMLAVVARGLVPLDCMAEEGVRVDLCTLDGVRTVLIDPSTGELIDAPTSDHGQSCPWCSSTPAAALPGNPTIFSRLPLALGLHEIPRVLHLQGRDATGLPFARGPPSSLSSHRVYR